MTIVRRTLWVCFSTALGLFALAQEPSTPPKQPTKPSTSSAFLEVGGLPGWGLDGNEHKLRQYATPPQGFFLRELSYAPLLASQGHQGWVVLRGIGQADYAVEGNAALRFGTAFAEGAITRHRFFDSVPVFLSPSERTVQEGFVKDFLTSDFALSFRYRMDQQDHFFEPPRSALRQLTRRWDALAGGKVGRGQMSLGYTDWRYFDRTDLRPDIALRRWEVRYLWEPQVNLGLEGAFARTILSQTGVPNNSHVETLTFVGDWAVAPTTDLSVTLRREQFDLPTVRNAFVRERNTGSVSLVNRWRNWTAKLGFRQQEAERVRKDQSFVDVPRWSTFEGRVSGRVGPSTRLTLRGFNQRLTHAPQMQSADSRALFWKEREGLQIKLDGGTPAVNGYLTWTYHRAENDLRLVGLTTRTLTAGGQWEISPHLSLFAEYTLETWTATSEISQTPTLDNFMSDNRTISIGLYWVINNRTILSSGYTDFTTNNDNPLLLPDGNTQGRFLTFHLRYRLPNGSEWVLTVAPWRYRDRVWESMNYDSTVVMLSGATKF